jgi:high-affinity iron transporter
MLTGSLVTIREGLEAFLIIGILLGYLTKIRQTRLKTYIWIGAGAAILLSAVLAVAFQALAVQFEGAVKEIFEASIALLAVGVLTWIVLWMQRQSRAIKGEIEHKVDVALSQGQTVGLAGLAFITVLREGLETALFLSAVSVSARGDIILPGALLGLVIAAGITYLIFHSSVRLNLRTFFMVTGILLIVIAAGLVGHSVMALQEIGWLPVGTAIAWNIGWLISNDGLIGRLLHAFTGYVAAPSVLMVVAYAAYAITFGTQFIRALRDNNVIQRNTKPT